MIQKRKKKNVRAWRVLRSMAGRCREKYKSEEKALSECKATEGEHCLT